MCVCVCACKALILYQAKVSTGWFLHNWMSDNARAFLSTHIPSANADPLPPAAFFPFHIAPAFIKTARWANLTIFQFRECRVPVLIVLLDINMKDGAHWDP